MFSKDLKDFLGRPDATDAEIEALRGTNVHIPKNRGRMRDGDTRAPYPVRFGDETRRLLAEALNAIAADLSKDGELTLEQERELRKSFLGDQARKLLGAAMEPLAADLMLHVPDQE